MQAVAVAAARELPYAEFLEQVLGEEVATKTSDLPAFFGPLLT